MRKANGFLHALIVALVLLAVSAATASVHYTLYGPGYGFNENPDLGTVLTKEEFGRKAKVAWVRNRVRSLFAEFPELNKLDPQMWSEAVVDVIESGMYTEDTIEVGRRLKAVSQTVNAKNPHQWSKYREWTSPNGAPAGYWDISVKDKVTGIVLYIGVIQKCGNFVYFDLGYEAPKPSPTPCPSPTPPPTPRRPPTPTNPPPLAWMWGQGADAMGTDISLHNPVAVVPVSDLPSAPKVDNRFANVVASRNLNVNENANWNSNYNNLNPQVWIDIQNLLNQYQWNSQQQWNSQGVAVPVSQALSAGGGPSQW